VVLAYLQRTSGYSRAQIKRLVARWHENRLAVVPLTKRYRAPAAPVARKYTANDIDLLVQMDRANEDVCGPAIAHLFKRAYHTYGDKRYERLAELSVSHLYNLRKSSGYQAQRMNVCTRRRIGRHRPSTRQETQDGSGGAASEEHCGRSSCQIAFSMGRRREAAAGAGTPCRPVTAATVKSL